MEQKKVSDFEHAVKIELDKAHVFNEDYSRNCFKAVARALMAVAEQEIYKKRMIPIYDNRTNFEDALDAAWESYKNGSMYVDGLEDDFHDCIFAKGFREGYLLGIKQNEKNGENKN